MNDRKHGFGEVHHSDGSIYKGSFTNDLKDGEGTLNVNG